MTPGEIYDLKRKNFIAKSQFLFHFLVVEFNFNKPVHEFYEQENGTIIFDSITFEQERVRVILKNAYHPVDYGFELIVDSERFVEPKMIFWKLKEDQNVQQDYLVEAVECLRNQLGRFINFLS